MSPSTAAVTIRPLNELDISPIVRIDEKVSGRYRPEDWERRIPYYIRRDPDASLVAEIDGEVVGFMLGEIRSGEFGLEEPTAWIDVLGVDPEYRRLSIGRKLAESMLAYFASSGAQSVRTLVEGEMEAIADFFTSLGFQPAPIQPFIKHLQTDAPANS